MPASAVSSLSFPDYSNTPHLDELESVIVALEKQGVKAKLMLASASISLKWTVLCVNMTLRDDERNEDCSRFITLCGRAVAAAREIPESQSITANIQAKIKFATIFRDEGREAVEQAMLATVPDVRR